MREIKFRAWYNGRMYAVNQIIWYSETNIVCGLTKPQVPGSQIWVGTTEAEVQEYTDLHDKQGKEIYEGDIVRYRHYNDVEVCYLVEYKEAGFYPFMDIWSGTHTLDGFEIIGNIYENPDLLEATT